MKHKLIKLELSTRERLLELCHTGNGVFSVSFASATPERILRGSTGISQRAAKYLAGKFVPLVCKNGRLYLIPELTPAGIPTDGSLNANVFDCYEVINVELSAQDYPHTARYLCTTCGRICLVNHCDNIPRCRRCGKPLKTAEEIEAHCCKECKRRDTAHIYSYHGRPYRSAPRFTRPEQRETELHVGAEVEIGGSDGAMSRSGFSSAVDKILNPNPFLPFIEFETDGSIEDGVECITAATTWAEFRRKDWAAFYAEAENAEGEFGRVNGVHYHFDRAYFGRRDMLASVKIEALLYKFFEFFRTISGRKKDNFGYAAKKSGVDDIEGAITYAHYKEHSLAVNTSNGGTIELRIFGGKIDGADDLLATRDIAEAVAKWAKKASLAAVVRATPLSLVRYLHNPQRVATWCEERLADRTAAHNDNKTVLAFVAACKEAKK